MADEHISIRPAPTGHGGTPWAYGQPHDYTHDAYGKAREAEVAATLATLRAKLSGARPPDPMPETRAGAADCATCGTQFVGRTGDRCPRCRHAADVQAAGPVRCDDCGYLTTAPGHLAECGGDDD